LRDRLIEATRPYLADGSPNDSPDIQYEAAITLAHWGVSQVDGWDIFSIITGRIPFRPGEFHTAMMALAALDDPRTPDFLATTYDSIRGRALPEETELLIATLNCLYHLSADEALLVATRIAENETDPVLRDRAKRVVERR